MEVAVSGLQWGVVCAHIPGKDITNVNTECGVHFRSDLGLAQDSISADCVGHQEVIESTRACESTSWG